MPKLIDPSYLQFPFRVGDQGPVTARREQHVEELIEQVLLTDPMERVFRPEFGAGVRRLVFEPNASPTWAMVHKRLVASLSDALVGEVDPRTLEVEVGGQQGELTIEVSYRLAAINRMVQHTVRIDGVTFG